MVFDFGKEQPYIASMAFKAGNRYRFYPTEQQAQMLARQFGCVRYVWNWALALKHSAYRERGEKIGYAETDRRLTGLKREEDKLWLQEVSSRPMKQTLRHLDKAYTAFFRGHARYPRFKSKHGPQSASYDKSGFSVRGGVIRIAKSTQPLKAVLHRPLPSEPSGCTITRETDGRYFISFVVEVNPEPLPKTKAAAGVDLGITDVVVTSDGWHSGNPKNTAKEAAKLGRAQRRLARKQKGSNNRQKQKLRVARIHARIRNRRRDFLHQMSIRLIRRYDTICTESLNVKGMVRNRSLSKAISDAGWGELLRMLEYKAEWYGRTLVQIDRFFPSSKTCSGCGFVVESLPLDIRRWTCPKCEAEHHRDVNAARNILAVGLTASACGGSGRPDVALVTKGGSH